jgi:diamine N-acetyltransferase
MTCQGNIVVRKFTSSDLDALLHYLHNLTSETKSRFGPHTFDAEGLIQFYNDQSVTGFIALDVEPNTIIAYSIIRDGILEHDKERLMGYQYIGLDDHACTYAPSVADSWRGKGIGKLMFDCILKDLRQKETRWIILWGGVQNSNKKALHFYQKLGFITLGYFEYNGSNQDMLLEL